VQLVLIKQIYLQNKNKNKNKKTYPFIESVFF
jgi:hypothetical protein